MEQLEQLEFKMNLYEKACLLEKKIDDLENLYRVQAEEAEHRNNYDSFTDQQVFVESRYKPTCWRCGQSGHIKRNCIVNLQHSRKQASINRVNQDYNVNLDAYRPYDSYGKGTAKSTTLPDGLVGNANIVDIFIEGVQTTALLDTGASISFINENLYNKYFSDMELHSLDTVLEVECADGKELPYLGYIKANISISGFPLNISKECLLLVVPVAESISTPDIVLGTNILQNFMLDCEDSYGPQYLQKAELHVPVYLAFRSIAIRNKQLKKTKNSIGVVKFGDNKSFIVQPNTSCVLTGYIDKESSFQDTNAMLVESKMSHLPSDLDISPSLLSYRYRNTGPVDVHISNLTTRTVVVQPHAILCEVHPVNIVDDDISDFENCDLAADAKDLLDKVHFSDTILSSAQLKELENLILNFQDIFSKGDIDIGHNTSNFKHRIDLTNDVPFKQKHRRIFPSMFNEVRDHLQQLLDAGIIRKSYSPWASNIVLVRKHDNSLRMCVDFRMLNQRTVKDSYSLPRVEEILDALSGSKYFSVLDMKSGFHQIDILESHKERTAFTVGPLGFWEFNRLPFGLSNSPASYQRLMEDSLGDLHLTICFIFLDDLIIFSKTFEEHMERLAKVLQRLRECNLKLSPKSVFSCRRRSIMLAMLSLRKALSLISPR